MQRETKAATQTEVKVSLLSALLTAVFAAVSCVLGAVTPARARLAQPADIVPFPYTNAATFIPSDYIWLVPGFLLALIFVVLMVCIHRYASEERKIFSQIGLSFSLVYAVAITTDYFIQLFVIQPSILNGETAGLSLFTLYNPHGIFLALESLGYLMMSVALLFAAAVFAKGKLERIIRWLFVTSFVLAVGSSCLFFTIKV